jgi:hypothetical protein
MAAKKHIPTSEKYGFIVLGTKADVTERRLVGLVEVSTVVPAPTGRTCAADPDSDVNSLELYEALGVGWNSAAR